MIYVTTDPNYTKLILDGQTHDVGTELLVSNLKANDYEVIVTKDGYYSWIKKLEVKQGETTFIRNLLLFKERDPISVHLFEENDQIIDSIDDATILQNGTELLIYEQKEDKLTSYPLPSSTTVQEIIYFSPADFTLKQDSIWYQNTPNGLQSIQRQLPPLTTAIKSTSDNRLYALTDIGIYRLETEMSETPMIQHALPQDIFKTGNKFWVISTEPAHQRSFIYEVVAEGTRPRLIHILPYSPTYKIERDVGGFLTVLDNSNRKIFLVDTKTSPPELAELSGVQSWEWSKDNTQLLTASDFELTIHHFENGETQELLLRLSSPITQTAWHPEGQHVFYVANDSLYLVERDNRQQRNTFALIENKKDLKILSVDSDGKKIWVSSINEKGQVEVSSLEIR